MQSACHLSGGTNYEEIATYEPWFLFRGTERPENSLCGTRSYIPYSYLGHFGESLGKTEGRVSSTAMSGKKTKVIKKGCIGMAGKRQIKSPSLETNKCYVEKESQVSTL